MRLVFKLCFLTQIFQGEKMGKKRLQFAGYRKKGQFANVILSV